jgi:probable FeS assembly SUF system protein SufT
MSLKETLILQRDVDVIYVPDGTPGTLSLGDIVLLHQALGGSYTVTTTQGRMARIAASDADALGKEAEALDTLSEGTDPESVERNVWEVLKTIYDPEIPVNIVALGLVYSCRVTPAGEGLNDVAIQMTLTAPGCGMGPVLQFDAERAIRQLPGVNKATVEVVFDPPWAREMMSEEAKLELGML